MAQLVARCADNAKVSGSNPDIRKFFWNRFFSFRTIRNFEEFWGLWRTLVTQPHVWQRVQISADVGGWGGWQEQEQPI
jgi:hypothetical protein